MTQKVGNPVPILIDARGTFMDDGNIYLGLPNADPQVSPIVAYWDAALTQVAAQPIKTLGGFIVNGTAQAEVFIAQSDYSMRMTDAFDVQVFYSPSVQQAGLLYQPLDSDLTTISGQANQSFGLSLLTLANSSALAAATGLSNFTGGTVTTNIIRQGGGVHTYWADPAMTGGRLYITAVGAADPTSLPGDLWFQV